MKLRDSPVEIVAGTCKPHSKETFGPNSTSQVTDFVILVIIWLGGEITKSSIYSSLLKALQNKLFIGAPLSTRRQQ